MTEKPVRVRMWIVVFLAVFLIGLPSSGFSAADVAIFNDTALQDGGAWGIGITHIKSMLSSFGVSYEDITPNTINTAGNLNSLYKVLLVPGGWAGAYNVEVNAVGLANIRNFVNNGGGFIGICAGAYFACNYITWQGTTYDYPLNLFWGTGVGSLGDIIDWDTSTGCESEPKKGAKMTSVQMTGFLPDLKSSLSIFYYGGPAFVFSEPDNSSVKVVARYSLPGSAYDSKPAMIFYNYGSGRVFLSGPHPEVSYSGCSLVDTADNWEIIRQVLKKFTQAKGAALTLPSVILMLD